MPDSRDPDLSKLLNCEASMLSFDPLLAVLTLVTEGRPFEFAVNRPQLPCWRAFSSSCLAPTPEMPTSLTDLRQYQTCTTTRAVWTPANPVNGRRAGPGTCWGILVGRSGPRHGCGTPVRSQARIYSGP